MHRPPTSKICLDNWQIILPYTISIYNVQFIMSILGFTGLVPVLYNNAKQPHRGGENFWAFFRGLMPKFTENKPIFGRYHAKNRKLVLFRPPNLGVFGMRHQDPGSSPICLSGKTPKIGPKIPYNLWLKSAEIPYSGQASDHVINKAWHLTQKKFIRCAATKNVCKLHGIRD